MPAVTKTMCAGGKRSNTTGWRTVPSSAAARGSFGLSTCAKPLGYLDTQLYVGAGGARCGERLRISVGDDEIDALQAERDHVVDSIASGTADGERGGCAVSSREGR